MCKTLIDLGYTICTGGTDCHLILVNLNPTGITGSKIEKLCDKVDISINKNSVGCRKIERCDFNKKENCCPGLSNVNCNNYCNGKNDSNSWSYGLWEN